MATEEAGRINLVSRYFDLKELSKICTRLDDLDCDGSSIGHRNGHLWSLRRRPRSIDFLLQGIGGFLGWVGI